MIRVAVVDDQGVIRAGLKMIIDHESDLVVVGEAADGLEAIALVNAVQPDVVLMDIRMPRLDGIEATRRITSTDSTSAVLILTTFDDEEYVLGAVRAGAAGFLLKDAGPDLLVSAVRALHGGDSLVDPAVTRTLIARCLALESRADQLSSGGLIGSTGPTWQTGSTGQAGSAFQAGGSSGESAAGSWKQRLETLSDREHQTLVGMARGGSNRDLAAEMVVSETTVKSHVSAVLAKLGLRSRVQAVVLAYEAGVIKPGQQPFDPGPGGDHVES
jgi:DNA-binding NarL/FixJ family response regulator